MDTDEPTDEEESLHFIKHHDAAGLLRELEAVEIILTSGAFDAADKARASHWQRFLLRIASLMDSNPIPKLEVGDVLSNDELEKIYQETADRHQL